MLELADRSCKKKSPLSWHAKSVVCVNKFAIISWEVQIEAHTDFQLEPEPLASSVLLSELDDNDSVRQVTNSGSCMSDAHRSKKTLALWK